MAGAGEVESVAFRRVLKLHGGALATLLFAIANSAKFSYQVLPLRPRRQLRQLPQLLRFRYEPWLRLRRRSAFVLVEKMAIAPASAPPEAELPETAAAAEGIRCSIVVAIAGVVRRSEGRRFLRFRRHFGIW